MMKKIMFCTIFFGLYITYVAAQPGNFSIRVTQVYPAGSVVYGNSYNLSSELEAAEKSLRSQYIGKDANYTVELIRPSGKESKVIQNINWVLIENGVRKNFKNKPVINNFYSQATSIELFACNNNGSRKEDTGNITKAYDHYCRLYLNDKEQETDESKHFLTLNDCKDIAGRIFLTNKPTTDSVLCEVKIFNAKETIVDDSFTNRNEYEQFKKDLAEKIKQQQRQQIPSKPVIVRNTTCQDELLSLDKDIKNPRGRNKSQLQNQAFDITMSCVDANLDPDYSLMNIDENLRLCQKAVDKYLVRENLLPQLNQIIERLDQIIDIMNTKQRVSFDRNKYFNAGNQRNLKSGINELIKINNKLR